MEDSGEYDVGANAPDEAKQREPGATDAWGSEAMNADGGWNPVVTFRTDGDEGEVDFVAFGWKVRGEQRGDAFGAASAEVGNEQKQPDSLRDGARRGSWGFHVWFSS